MQADRSVEKGKKGEVARGSLQEQPPFPGVTNAVRDKEKIVEHAVTKHFQTVVRLKRRRERERQSRGAEELKVEEKPNVSAIERAEVSG